MVQSVPALTPHLCQRADELHPYAMQEGQLDADVLAYLQAAPMASCSEAEMRAPESAGVWYGRADAKFHKAADQDAEAAAVRTGQATKLASLMSDGNHFERSVHLRGTPPTRRYTSPKYRSIPL